MRVIAAFFMLMVSLPLVATENAKALFAEFAPSLYQIRLIENASGEKSSIGSGFQIDENGLIATNYHVISGFAQHPNKYRLEFLDVDGNKGELSLHSVDVVNDLALVKHDESEKSAFFNVSTSAPTKGDELYSLGNPHDLGMIVVPGTYNGIKKESFNERIHFTGSVNPGMSGGPVVDAEGEVVGINVATSGNQIGFLVPSDKLVQLVKSYRNNGIEDIDAQITGQLHDNQFRLINSMMESPWELKQLGKALVPQIDVPFIRCWGESNADKKDALYFAAVASCTLDEDIYISDNFYTGSLEMQFRWMESKKLNPMRFYHLYKKQISRVRADNKATKHDVTEFKCQHDTVLPNESMTSKSILCVRAYKKYDNLFDVLFVGASIDHEDYAMVSHFTLSGVSKKESQAFSKRFMESVKWN